MTFHKRQSKVVKIKYEVYYEPRYGSSPAVEGEVEADKDDAKGEVHKDSTVYLWSERETWNDGTMINPHNGSSVCFFECLYVKLPFLKSSSMVFLVIDISFQQTPTQHH